MPGDARVLTGTAGPGLLDAVHELLDRLWDDAPAVPAGDRMAFVTAVAEVAANVVEHAAAGAASPVPVEVAVGVDGGVLTAALTDGGIALPPLADPADADPLAETGRGLAMARALCDEVAYTRDDGLNRWRLVRRCRG